MGAGTHLEHGPLVGGRRNISGTRAACRWAQEHLWNSGRLLIGAGTSLEHRPLVERRTSYDGVCPDQDAKLINVLQRKMVVALVTNNAARSEVY